MDTLENINEQNALNLITWASATHVGMRRTENQDSHGQIERDNFKFFIVADGMGGVSGGAVASSLAIEAIKNAIEGINSPTESDLLAAINAANQAVFNRGLEDRGLSGMGTTLVGLLFYSNRLYCINVGDSRAYLIRDGLVMQLTQDHTVVSELLRSGAIDENQVANHPISHMLTRSIGPTADIDADCFVVPNAPLASDRYLLCSDGLYNHVDSAEFAAIVAREIEVESVCERLIELANERGGSDNITVTVINIDPNYSSPTLEFDNGDTRIISSSFEARETKAEFEKNHKQHNSQDTSQFYEKMVKNSEQKKSKKTKLSDIKKEPLANNNLNDIKNNLKRLNPLSAFIVLVVVLILWQAIDRSGPRSRLDVVNHDVDSEQVQVALAGNKNSDLSEVPTVEEVPQAAQKQEEAAEIESELSSQPIYEAASDIEQELLPTQPLAGIDDNLFNQPFSSARLERARVRMKFLQTQAVDLESKLAAFDQPLSGAVAQSLSVTSRQLENIKSKISDIDGELADTARGLAVLYGQQQRMRSMELLKLAAEVAKVSPTVDKQKRAFEAVSWRYLKEREKIEKDPRNLELRQRVDELALERRQELDRLGYSVRQSIIADTLELDKKSAALNASKEILEKELLTAQSELNYLSVLLSQDPKRRDSLKTNIEQDLLRTKAEFATLQNLILKMLGEEDSPAQD